jgi:hypothetical protein
VSKWVEALPYRAADIGMQGRCFMKWSSHASEHHEWW